MLHRLGVGDENVQLGTVAGAHAGGGGDIHAGVTDRGRDLSERPGGVLDVDDQIDRHLRRAAVSLLLAASRLQL